MGAAEGQHLPQYMLLRQSLLPSMMMTIMEIKNQLE